jgi:hypothetical protein
MRRVRAWFVVAVVLALLTPTSYAGSEASYVNAAQKAAERGNTLAQTYLGGLYLRGKGVPKDYAKAMRWYIKSAEQGDVTAQLFLGSGYHGGPGFPKDMAKAMHWYRKAAEQGNAAAQKTLGWGYYFGNAIPKEYSKAIYWFKLAAEQGNAKAQLLLGMTYEDGQRAGHYIRWSQSAPIKGRPTGRALQCATSHCVTGLR